jgi:hypothetical protein
MSRDYKRFKRVDIESLKDFVLKLPVNSALRQLILMEPNHLKIDTFLSRVETWLRLLDIERGVRTEASGGGNRPCE